MRKIAFFLIGVLFTQVLPAQQNTLLLQNIQIVDIQKGLILPLSDLLIQNQRIQKIMPTGTLIPADDWIVFNGNNNYLIPGMWDMHAHPDDPEVWRMNPVPEQRDWLLPQFVLHGVTGIRDMAGSLELAKEWKDKIAKGTLLGPVIFAGGPLLDGPNPMWDGSVGINAPSEVPRIVDSLVVAGVDFLKVYSLLPRDVYLALANYANEKGITFVGHVPFNVKTSEASETGMKSQEHCLEILKECSAKEEDLLNKTIDYGTAISRFDRYIFREKLMLNSYDEKKAAALFQIFVKNETWHTPTLSLWYKNAYFEEEVLKDSALLKYLPPYLQKYWTPEINDHLRYRSPAFLEIKRLTLEKFMQVVKQMQDSGVKLLCGTDVGANPLCFPGIGVHNELEMLVKAGLTPTQALQTATIHPAQFLGIDQDYGTIEIGKMADLVLLKNNPIEDIQAVRKISAVVRNGVLIDQTARQKLLKEIVEIMK